MTIDLTILLVAWQLSRLMTSHPDVKERETEQERHFLKSLISMHSYMQSWIFFCCILEMHGVWTVAWEGFILRWKHFLQSCNPCMYWGLQNSHYFGTVSDFHLVCAHVYTQCVLCIHKVRLIHWFCLCMGTKCTGSKEVLGRINAGSAYNLVRINRFTAPGCKIHGLKDASVRLQTVCFPVL